MITESQPSISRRGLLKWVGAGSVALAATGALSACSPAQGNLASTQGDAEVEPESNLQERYADLPVEESSAYAVIVGGGAGGLLAAYKLAKEGKAPLLLEKGPSCVSSNLATLSGPAACNTSNQKASGIAIATERALYDHYVEWARGSANTKLLKNLLSNSTEAFESLVDCGLHFYNYVEYTGDPQYGESLKWAPLHNFVEVGEERIQPIVSAIEGMGGSFIYNCEATEIVLEDGAVVGVKAIRDNETVLSIDTKAVFLATGGFGANEEMVHDRFLGVSLVNMGTPTNSGDGIRMAEAAGAVCENYYALISNEICGANQKHGSAMYDADWNLNNENLCFAIYGGLMVDESGERFMNEQNMAFDPLVYSGQAGLNNGNYYVLVDGEYYDACVAEGVYKYLGEPDWNFGREMFYPVLSHASEQFEAAASEGWAVKGNTIAECAEAFGLTNLEETVKRYNELCQNNEDTDFGKNPMFLTEIKDGKGYYLFEYQSAYWATLGGIRTNDRLTALDADNKPIDGLFIGGLNMGSAFCRPYYDIPGTACGLSIASGVTGAKEIIRYLEG